MYDYIPSLHNLPLFISRHNVIRSGVGWIGKYAGDSFGDQKQNQSRNTCKEALLGS